jgi:hypothetical protein
MDVGITSDFTDLFVLRATCALIKESYLSISPFSGKSGIMIKTIAH